MDIPASPWRFAALEQLQSQPEIEVECVRLIKVHYLSNPQVVLEKCIHQGYSLDRPEMIQAALAIAPKLVNFHGCANLSEELQTK